MLEEISEQPKVLQISQGLGDDQTGTELVEIERAIAAAEMPEEAEKVARKDLKRLALPAFENSVSLIGSS